MESDKVLYTLTLTTQRLLNQLNAFQGGRHILHADGTFSFNGENSVGLFVSTSDTKNQMHPLSFSVASGEARENYLPVLQQLKDHNAAFRPVATMSDGAERFKRLS